MNSLGYSENSKYMGSQSSPDKPSPDEKTSGNKHNIAHHDEYDNEEEDKYDDDNYEDEEPVPTKPFDNSMPAEAPVDQSEVLKMISNPVERPSTRNPRMQRNGERKKNTDNNYNEGSLGDISNSQNSKFFINLRY